MPQRWYFDVAEDEVHLVARAEGDGIVGDARRVYRPGDVSASPPGITYEALRAAGGGVLEIADDRTSFRIIPAEASAPSAIDPEEIRAETGSWWLDELDELLAGSTLKGVKTP